MKNNLRRLYALVAILTLTILGSAQENLGGGRLAGTWDVRVTIRNCQTGGEIMSFDSITQFMQGGMLLDSTSSIPQSQKTPGQGIWRHVQGNTYRFTFKAFHFDAAGNYVEYRIVTHDAEMDPSGDSYSSAGTVRFFSPDGTLMRSGCSSTTAKRLEF